jgi:hypothetical protein
MGTASFFLPRTSPVWDSGVLATKGGQAVKVTNGRKVWLGVADVPTWQEDGADITALEIGEWVGIQQISRAHEFYSATAGLIVGVAFREAFSGIASLPITIGPIVEAAPIISRYSFSPGQSLLSILGDMQDQSGQTWDIDHATGVVRWQMSAGRYHEGLHVDGGRLVESIKPGALRDRYQQVTEYDQRTRRSFTAWDGSTPPLWPAKTSIEV